MKTKLIFIIASLFILSFSYGQEKYIGKTIIFKVPAKHDQTNNTTNELYLKDSKIVNFLGANIHFNVIGKTKIDSIVYYELLALPYKKRKPNSIKTDLSEYYNNKIYYVTENELINKAIIAPEKIDKFSIGLLTIPFKFRTQGEKSFDTEFNLNSTLNMRLTSSTKSNLFLQIGAGIGSVNLNSNNASGVEDDKVQDVATLTFLSGLMLQYNKAQAGLYFGVDHVNNQKNYKWENNGHIWFGFGVSYNLFQIGVGTSKEKNKQK